MASYFPEPPEWWVKYKPLRWVLAALVVYYVLGTLMPRWKAEAPLPEVPPEVTATDTAPAPTAEVPPPPPPEPAPEAPEPKPEAAPKPAAPPQPPSEPEPEVEPEPDPMARYTAVEAERMSFMNGSLRSYDSVDKVQAWLREAGYTPAINTIERSRRSDRDPPFRNDTLSVNEFKHGQYEGTLTLEFFNDRLYQADFAPKEAANYLRWLRNQGTKLPIKRVGITTLTAGHLEVTSNIDFAASDVGQSMGSKPFVRWQDSRLTKQVQDAR